MAYYAPGMKFRLFLPQLYFVKQQLDGQFVMNKMSVYFELNDKYRIKIALNAVNLSVALASNTADVTSENLALYSCATDATNTNLPAKAKRLLQSIIGWDTAIFGLRDGWFDKDTWGAR